MPAQECEDEKISEFIRLHYVRIMMMIIMRICFPIKSNLASLWWWWWLQSVSL